MTRVTNLIEIRSINKNEISEADNSITLSLSFRRFFFFFFSISFFFIVAFQNLPIVQQEERFRSLGHVDQNIKKFKIVCETFKEKMQWCKEGNNFYRIKEMRIQMQIGYNQYQGYNHLGPLSHLTLIIEFFSNCTTSFNILFLRIRKFHHALKIDK